MPEDDIAVEVNNLSKDFALPHERKNTLREYVVHFSKPTFEMQHALKDISFQIKRGEFFGIVGRNGSGKSTLLKIIASIYKPTKGGVVVNGTLTPFIELGIGFNAELSGRDNVFLNGAILGLTRKEVMAKYDSIVEFSELERFMDQKLKNYSSGMQVRLAFSIAMQAHNDILLIDEVLAVGDERFQRKSLDIFEQIKKEKSKTVIFVSHDMQTVQQFCDRALVIHDSQIKYIGSAERAALEYKKLNFPESVEVVSEQDERSKGSNQINITNIKIEDRTDKNERIIPAGEKFSIRIHYDAKQDVNDLVFGIAIKSKQGESIYGPNTKESDLSISLKKGKGSITLVVEDNIFSPGIYDIEAGIFNDNSTLCYDYRKFKNAITFTGKGRFGYVYINPEWTIK